MCEYPTPYTQKHYLRAQHNPVHPPPPIYPAAHVPMSKCKKDALSALQRDLKKYLSLEELIDLLEKPAGGFMTEAEKMSVCEQPNRRDKVEQILTVLRRKRDQDFEIFIKLLRASGNEIWAEQLEQKVQQLERKSKGGGWG